MEKRGGLPPSLKSRPPLLLKERRTKEVRLTNDLSHIYLLLGMRGFIIPV
jgi:hypothetical protein